MSIYTYVTDYTIDHEDLSMICSFTVGNNCINPNKIVAKIVVLYIKSNLKKKMTKFSNPSKVFDSKIDMTLGKGLEYNVQ